MPNKPYQRIYLSPHLDDVALSCGGRVYQECQAGYAVLVLTLMAGDAPPDAMESPIIAALHARWQLETSHDPVAVRRAEDLAALTLLGADTLHWEWPECVYRRHPRTDEFLYPSEESLWGPVHPADQKLITDIARRLADLRLAPGGRVYAPLTIGNHIDHRLVRQAAVGWGPPEGELVYYEDYPYAERPKALAAVLKDGPGWQAEAVPLDDMALSVKADAIACYRSQISSFFDGTDEISPRLRAYAAIAGEGKGYAERYWSRS
jgi:LmbE family N-acetylglucosaminyl deacetylase